MLQRVLRSRLLFGPPIALAVVVATAWGVGALYYAELPVPASSRPHSRRSGCSPSRCCPGLVLSRPSWRSSPSSSSGGSESRRPPTVPGSPTLPSRLGDVAGDRVTIHGVRNFQYKSETDFAERWEDRTYDVARLDTVDLIASYWAGRAIAHVFVSFGFGPDHVAVSVETRMERHEQYSTISGLFKQYELVYVVADEADVVRLRTTVRQPNEDVYVYRLRGTPGEMRRVFFRYVEAINDLYAHPRFYNTVTTNQLRDGRAVQPADESGRRAVDVEDPAQRLRAAVRLRHGPARHVAAISGARASCERQRARARRRREPSLRRADSRGPSRAEITMTHRRTQPAAGQVTEGGTSVQAGGWSCRRWRSIRAAR
jgi:Domain of unknown function (DUF4105)